MFLEKLSTFTPIQYKLIKNPHMNSTTQIKPLDTVTLHFLNKKRLFPHIVMSSTRLLLKVLCLCSAEKLEKKRKLRKPNQEFFGKDGKMKFWP